MNPAAVFSVLTGYTYRPKPGKYPGDVGIDLHADIDKKIILPPLHGQFIWSGFQIQCTPGWFGLVIGRSSMNRKGFHVPAGIIDTGYAGPLGAEVRNISHESQVINPGDRIAQFILIPASNPVPIFVDQFEPTERSNRGWGSSGK